MTHPYQIADTSSIITPGLIVFRELLEENIDKMIAIAGDIRRLRPHCKTHKMRQVIELELSKGIIKHKAATFAEAEMLAEAGVKDIVLAYNLVGPNIARAVAFLTKYADVSLIATADHEKPVMHLGQAMQRPGLSIGLLLDIDSGQHRTGIPAGEQAAELYRKIASTPGLRAEGIHLYDGQNHQVSRDERREAVRACWNPVAALRDQLTAEGLPVPRIVAGGTGSFPLFAEISDPAIELSPGTCVLNDAGYGKNFPDLEFTPAAVLLTRVVSRPTADRVTVDLGYKAVASDPPAGSRVIFPELPDAEAVLQNEEHLVLKTARAGEFTPGDELIAIPRHICPTSALHKEVAVVVRGEVVERWPVASRDRWLTV